MTESSIHGVAFFYGEAWWWGTWDETAQCVRTVKTAFDLTHGFRLRHTRGTPSGLGVRDADATQSTALPIRRYLGNDLGSHAA